MNIVLIGFMGTGKSAVGRALARRLGVPLLDSDAEIERQWQMSIPRLFAEHGEETFRAAETAFLRRTGARRFSTVAAVTDCTVVEFDPDVLWLASEECTRSFHQAFLTALADKLENAEGALAELLAANKNVTLF